MISKDVMTRLRQLVTELQDSPTATMPDWQRAQRDGYTLGLADGQIQAGNDLEALLDDLSDVERRPDS